MKIKTEYVGWTVVILLIVIGVGTIGHCEWTKRDPENRMELVREYEAEITKIDVYGRYTPYYIIGFNDGFVLEVDSSLWAIIEEGDVVYVKIYRHQILHNHQELIISVIDR